MNFTEEDLEIFDNGGHVYIEDMDEKGNNILKVLSKVNGVMNSYNQLGITLASLPDETLDGMTRMLYNFTQPLMLEYMQRLAPWSMLVLMTQGTPEVKEFIEAYSQWGQRQNQRQKDSLVGDDRFTCVNPLSDFFNNRKDTNG